MQEFGGYIQDIPIQMKIFMSTQKLDDFNILDFQDTQSILSLTDLQAK